MSPTTVRIERLNLILQVTEARYVECAKRKAMRRTSVGIENVKIVVVRDIPKENALLTRINILPIQRKIAESLYD